MHFLVHIAGWLCLGVLGLIAVVYVIVGVVATAEKVQQRRRRRELASHAAFGVGRGHENESKRNDE